ncbi:hypothetical protein FRC06_003866, partial [Ceratobasidium sp. 370]
MLQAANPVGVKYHPPRMTNIAEASYISRTQQNRNGVEVSGAETGLDLGLWTPGRLTNEPAVVWISNTLPTPVYLTEARTSSSLGVRPGLQLWVAVQVHFDPRGQRGRFEDRLELVFRQAGGDIFIITRPLKAVVANSDVTSLAPVAPFQPRRLARKRNAKVRIVSGGEELWPNTGPNRRPLPPATIPTDLEQLLNHGALDQRIQAFSDKFMPNDLTASSYKQYWSSLVHAEHLQA